MSCAQFVFYRVERPNRPNIDLVIDFVKLKIDKQKIVNFLSEIKFKYNKLRDLLHNDKNVWNRYYVYQTLERRHWYFIALC